MAKVPFLKPAFHSLEKDFSLAVMPASTMLTEASQASLTAGLLSMTSESSVSK